MTQAAEKPMRQTSNTPLPETETSTIASDSFERSRRRKHGGYPELCRYIASDNDGFLFRRFGELNARVLLNLQHEIESQEQLLEELDEECRQDSDTAAQLNSLSWDKHPLNKHRHRNAVLKDLQPLLHTYNEHLATYSLLRNKEPVSEHKAENLKNWIQNRSIAGEKDSGPIVDIEQQYLDSGADLVSITTTRKTAMVRALERSRVVRWMFRQRPRRGQIDDLKTTYYSDRKMEVFANAITVMLGLIMLYGPMWWLSFVSDDSKRLGIITAFVFFFAIGLSLIGSGRPFETLAATAAYAAVLMVFLQVGAKGV